MHGRLCDARRNQPFTRPLGVLQGLGRREGFGGQHDQGLVLVQPSQATLDRMAIDIGHEPHLAPHARITERPRRPPHPPPPPPTPPLPHLAPPAPAPPHPPPSTHTPHPALPPPSPPPPKHPLPAHSLP